MGGCVPIDRVGTFESDMAFAECYVKVHATNEDIGPLAWNCLACFSPVMGWEKSGAGKSQMKDLLGTRW